VSDRRSLELGAEKERHSITILKILPDSRIIAQLPPFLTHDEIEEMAILAYFHRNPFVRYIITARLNAIVKAGGFQSSDVVMDFGTGSGILLPTLSKRVSEVIATDLRTELARRMIRLDGLKNVRIIELDEFERLPPRTVSKVVAADVLEHVPDLDDVLTKFSKVLRPGGKLIISGPTETRFYKLCRTIAGFSGHYHVRSVFDIEKTLERRGFKLEVRQFLPPLLPTKLFLVLVVVVPETS
jgi:tRNA A58 N-methylase Trm61